MNPVQSNKRPTGKPGTVARSIRLESGFRERLDESTHYAGHQGSTKYVGVAGAGVAAISDCARIAGT
jgi:hypothetical protein